uniref:Coatomer subunit zeta n=1 Tax=Sinocyclocheilus rhinocerous TaxID=307959 RepID=A0A673HPV0_9TELE
MDTLILEPSLYTVKAVLIMDNDGERLYAKLMLMSVLNCLFDSLSQMLRKNVEKRALLENMEGLFLAIDEIVDGGVILESDPQQVVHRVALRGDDVPLTEQTVTQVRAVGALPSVTPVAIMALMFYSSSEIYP